MIPHLRVRARLVLLILATLTGCKEPPKPMPATYPVAGKVSYKKGGPIARATITFRSAADVDTQMISTGTTGDDGTFTLITIRVTDHRETDGAPEGEYRVTIIPNQGQEQTRTALPIDWPSTVKVQAKDKNEFTFEVDKPRP